MEDAKNWWQSKTVWLALLQAVAGFLTGLIMVLKEGMTPEAFAALSVGLKGLVDLKLRFITTKPIA